MSELKSTVVASGQLGVVHLVGEQIVRPGHTMTVTFRTPLRDQYVMVGAFGSVEVARSQAAHIIKHSVASMVHPLTGPEKELKDLFQYLVNHIDVICHKWRKTADGGDVRSIDWHEKYYTFPTQDILPAFLIAPDGARIDVSRLNDVQRAILSTHPSNLIPTYRVTRRLLLQRLKITLDDKSCLRASS